MKGAFIIAILLAMLAGRAQTPGAGGGGPDAGGGGLFPSGLRGIGADTVLPVAAIDDSREEDAEVIPSSYVHQGNDSAFFKPAAGLEKAWRTGNIHGIAVALACRAVVTRAFSNDFVELEKLSQASLYWFGRTTNKKHIAIAYYQLGFALFAQSRFDEAIGYLEKAKEWQHRSGESSDEIYTLELIGEACRERGNYERAFDIYRRCLQLAEAKDTDQIKMLDFSLAELFMQIEDYASAEKYFQAGFGTMRPETYVSWTVMKYAELLGHQHKYDSALYYYGRFDSAHAPVATLRTYLVSKGEYYLLLAKYGEALPYLIKSLSYQRQLNDRNQVMRCLLDLARCYKGLNRDVEAFRYSREVLSLAGLTDARQNIRDGSQLLYILYDKKGRTDSAYYYYRRYISMKDSVLNDQVKGKFASYGFEQQIKWLNQEKRLQDVCLRQEMLTKNILIGGIVVLFLLSFIYTLYIRVKRKNEAHLRRRAENELEIQRLEGERAKAALQQRAKELEIQALRSQMNPHFIFNCLNAINRFILSHETEAASDYLTKFSRLMRMIMNHSRHSTITLAEELEVLQLYLDMERLRFKDAFDYQIVLDENVDAGDLYVPPLLLQPFVENAIWHGLMHKLERGLLTITLSVEKDLLTCTIRDNGVGRKRADLLKSKSAQKHKSMGLQITAERMALLTGKEGSGHFFRIEDLYESDGKAAGTEVILTIRINDHSEEPADIII
jgi:tetratricopeptide (TPR) repeat protein